MDEKLDSQKSLIENNDFLKTIYEQSHLTYLQFVGIRFQIIGLLVLNAVLFDFLDDSEKMNSRNIIVSISALFFTLVIFLVDKRNQYIFKRAAKIANNIENHFNIPGEMQLHRKESEKNFFFSHTTIVLIITIIISFFG